MDIFVKQEPEETVSVDVRDVEIKTEPPDDNLLIEIEPPTTEGDFIFVFLPLKNSSNL
jgi:hypothetical protein